LQTAKFGYIFLKLKISTVLNYSSNTITIMKTLSNARFSGKIVGFALSAFIVSASQSAFATDYTVPGGTSRTTLTTGTTNDDTYIFNSVSGIKYQVNGTSTIKSVSVINGAVDIAIGTLNIDINAASGTVNALTGSSWSMNYFDLNFKNSVADSTALAQITLTGALNVLSGSTGGTQYQNMSFANINAAVGVGGTTTIGNDMSGSTGGNTSKLNINSGATVAWTGAISVGKYGQINATGAFTANSAVSLLTGANLNVLSGGTFNSNGTLTANAGSFVTIASGGTFNVGSSGTLALNATSTTAINGTFNASTVVTFGGIVNSSGAVNISSGGNLTINRAATLNSGAYWTVYDKVTLQGASGEGNTAVLTVNDGAKLSVTRSSSNGARVIFSGNATVILNAANALVINGSEAMSLVTVMGTTNNKLYINANQSFNNLFVNTSTFDMYLDDTSTVTFSLASSAITFTTEADLLNIYNFREDAIYVGTNQTIKDGIISHTKLYDDAGELLGSATVIGGYIALVPEPAAWAAIFGAAALGFALMRRRRR